MPHFSIKEVIEENEAMVNCSDDGLLSRWTKLLGISCGSRAEPPPFGSLCLFEEHQSHPVSIGSVPPFTDI